MTFGKSQPFKPSTRKQLKKYASRAKQKEKEKPKAKLDSPQERLLKQVRLCKNTSMLKLAKGLPSKLVKKNGAKFLEYYFELLAAKDRVQRRALKKEPKKRLMWRVVAPVIDVSQPGQFCYDLEGTWCVYGWEDISELLGIAVGTGKCPPELSPMTELVKRAMRQVLGIVSDKRGFSLSSPKHTLKLWEPLRKKYMGKKQKLREQIEAIDETPKKKKKRKDIAAREASTEPKKLKKELNGKPAKSERAARAKNLKPDDRLKPSGERDYKKGMGEVWELLPKKGITVTDFFKAAKKKRLDPVRTRMYLAVMRRDGAVEVRS